MAGFVNKMILIGNVGKDPDMKMTPTGQAATRFSVATTETWKDAKGDKQSKTEWHNVVVWGKQAEIAEKYVRKGKQIYVEGSMTYREYTDQSGVKKTFAEVKVSNFVLLGNKDKEDGEASGGAPAPSGSFGAPGSFDDDIPF